MPGLSLDTSQLRTAMEEALLEALPPDMVDQTDTKKLSAKLEQTINDMLSGMLNGNTNTTIIHKTKTAQESIDQFGNQPSADSMNNMSSDEFSASEVAGTNAEKTESDEEDERPKTEKQDEEKPASEQQEKEPSDEPEEASEEEKAEAEDKENSGFETPADERADMTQPAIPEDTDKQKESDNAQQQPTSSPVQNDQQVAMAMTQARNKERHKQTIEQNRQGQQQTQSQKKEDDMLSQTTYPIILMLCFFRDIVAIIQLIPAIGIMATWSMGAIFVGIFAAIALLDTKFFIFLLKELFGIQFNQESAVKKGAEAAAKKIGMAIWEILLIFLVYIVWPYTFFFMYYRGRYLKQKRTDGNPKKPTGRNQKNGTGEASPHRLDTASRSSLKPS